MSHQMTPYPAEERWDSYGRTVAEAETSVRAGFIRAVYGLLAVSLMFAIAGAWLSATTDLKVWVIENWILMLILYIGTIIGAFALRHSRPINMVLMYGFTFVTGLWIGPVAYVYPGPALNAGVTTAAIFVGLSIYAHVSKTDFHFLGGFLFMGLIGIIIMMLVNIFLLHSTAIAFGVSVVGVVIFCGFILYDTSNIMKRYPPSEYISATLALYLDVLNLFWFLLRLFIEFSGDR
jgi:FtsH-binding integral membrane protein